VLVVVVGIAALAAFNSLCVPLRLEYQISVHRRTPVMLAAAAAWGPDFDGPGKVEPNMTVVLEAFGDRKIVCGSKGDVKMAECAPPAFSSPEYIHKGYSDMGI
jgi:hypothetical protein